MNLLISKYYRLLEISIIESPTNTTPDSSLSRLTSWNIEEWDQLSPLECAKTTELQVVQTQFNKEYHVVPAEQFDVMKQHIESWFRIASSFQTDLLTANQPPVTPPDFNEFITLLSDETTMHEKTIQFHKIKSVTNGAKMKNGHIKFNDTNKKIRADSVAVAVNETTSPQLGMKLFSISKPLNKNAIKCLYGKLLRKLRDELRDELIDDDTALKSGEAIDSQEYKIKGFLKNKAVNFFKNTPKIQHSFFNDETGEEVAHIPNSSDEYQSIFESTYLTDTAINNRLAIPLIISDEFLDGIIVSTGLKVNFQTFLNDHVQWMKIFYHHNKNTPDSVTIKIQASFIPQKNLFSSKLKMINGNESVHLFLQLTIENHKLSLSTLCLSTNKCVMDDPRTLKKNSSSAALTPVTDSLSNSLSNSLPNSLPNSLSASRSATPLTSTSSEMSLSWPSIQCESSKIAFLASQIHFPKQHIDEAYRLITVFTDLNKTDHERKLAFEKCRTLCKPESKPKFMVMKSKRQLTYQFYDTKLDLTLYPLTDELVRGSIQEQLTQLQNGGENAEKLKADFETDKERKTNILVTGGTQRAIGTDELLERFNCNSKAITAICSQSFAQMPTHLVEKQFSAVTDEPAYNTFVYGNSYSGVIYYYEPLENGRLKISTFQQKDINILGVLLREEAAEFSNPNSRLPIRRSQYSEMSIILDNNELEKVECCTLYCGSRFDDNFADSVESQNLPEIDTITQEELLIEAEQWFTPDNLGQGQTAIKQFLDVTKPTKERVEAFQEAFELCSTEHKFNFSLDEDSNSLSYNILSFSLVLKKTRLERRAIEQEFEKYNDNPQAFFDSSQRPLQEQFLFCTHYIVHSDEKELLNKPQLMSEKLINIDENRDDLCQTRKQEIERHISSEDLDALSYLRETTHSLMFKALGSACSETVLKGVINQKPTWNIVVMKKSDHLDVTIEATSDIKDSETFIQLLKSTDDSSYEQQRCKWQTDCAQGGLASQLIKISVKIANGKISFVYADYHYEELPPQYSDDLWLEVLRKEYSVSAPEEELEASDYPTFYLGASGSNSNLNSLEKSISASSNNNPFDSLPPRQPWSIRPNSSPASLNTGSEHAEGNIVQEATALEESTSKVPEPSQEQTNTIEVNKDEEMITDDTEIEFYDDYFSAN